MKSGIYALMDIHTIEILSCRKKGKINYIILKCILLPDYPKTEREDCAIYLDRREFHKMIDEISKRKTDYFKEYGCESEGSVFFYDLYEVWAEIDQIEGVYINDVWEVKNIKTFFVEIWDVGIC